MKYDIQISVVKYQCHGGLWWQIDNHHVQFVKDGGIAVFYGGLRGIINILHKRNFQNNTQSQIFSDQRINMRYKCVCVWWAGGNFFFLAWLLLDNDPQSIFTHYCSNLSKKLFQSYIKSIIASEKKKIV